MPPLNQQVKDYRTALMKTIKPRIQAYIATESVFPDHAALHTRAEEEAAYALTKHQHIQQSGYDARRDTPLITKIEAAARLFRSCFKDSASCLIAVLHPDLAPPGINVLHEDQPLELSEGVSSAEQACARRRDWIAGLLVNPSESPFLHRYSERGVMIGLFENANMVPLILDMVLFQKSSEIGHTFPDLFADGLPDTLFSLAGSAALCSLDEFRTGSYVQCNFSRELYLQHEQALRGLIQRVKRNQPALAERYRNLSKNIVQRGRLWAASGSGIVSDG
ncbi:hypothetical protein DENSPDRAFT_877415 [Dentipellis sp. KUC8613]|nr:hypothetical protein DENSPDRAFT_877415 [Dentipellis sp. KUC8613]